MSTNTEILEEKKWKRKGKKGWVKRRMMMEEEEKNRKIMKRQKRWKEIRKDQEVK